MSETNVNARLEAFSDGVFSIALTLLIIDIKIPPSATINSTHAFWVALERLIPSMVAFLLSFIIILINWVNHHATFKLINKSSQPFIYANGLMLLSVVFIPFPTALIGEYFLTDHVAPAVVLYSAVCAFQSIGWNLLTVAALTAHPPLTKNENATLAIRRVRRYSYFAFVPYSACAVVAFWFPKAVAVFLVLTWIVWLVVGVITKGE